MRGVHTFFVLGSTGFVLTALLHMLISYLSGSASIWIWAPLYLNWATFMFIGLMQMMRQTKLDSAERRD